MLWLWAQPAAAGDLDPAAFAPPVLDHVAITGEPDAGALTTYRFDGRSDWPAIRLQARRPLDWSAAGSLAIEVDNPDARPFTLLLRLDDDPRADGGDASLTGLVDLAARTRATVVLPLAAGPPGMRSRPPGGVTAGPGERVVTDIRGTVDLHHVVALHVSGVRGGSVQEMRIGAPHLREEAPRTTPGGPLVDGFGQAVAGDWPEKVTDTADLRRRLAAAESATRQLARTIRPTVDAYGGLASRDRFDASGFFRVEQRRGRWTLVTPAGHPFYSLGVDAVTAANPTVTTGRAALFPPVPAVLSRHVGTDDRGRATFDIGGANLERGLGPDWPTRWRAAVVQRLTAWGFNTLGNWSDPSLGGLPFVLFTDVEGASDEVPMEGGRALPDPFDPRFAGVAAAVARQMTAAGRQNPFLLGYFSGNEMPWGEADKPASGIAAHVLTLPRTSFAKQAFVEGLRERYGTLEAFATAWGLTGLARWSDLPARRDGWLLAVTPAARDDIAAFQSRFADRYFRTVAEALKRADPNHLYLGTRFAAAPPEVVRACARWCDVLSFNVYGSTPESAASRWRDLHRPVLIGEFHFGSPDRGAPWPGMIDVGREARRGPAYAAYLAAALRDPAIVGGHWYQYADEPVTGRPYDGENGHIGLVAVTDVPYAGFVAAVAAANRLTLAAFARQVDRP